ncbi:hypothetical protein, partial [Faecalicoccus pleomorphus]|uniref:hypothetical protein n=1 Tax=Faecalicoccus pleomorphus TaxID=1323 RepID=UPI001980F0F3
PNSEVKHFSGDNSWACPCQDSTLPGHFFYPVIDTGFFCLYSVLFSRFYQYHCIFMYRIL